MQLSRLHVGAFLKDHWQKAPLLIRNPWDAWANPLEPDELAGLACEDGVEARLVERTPKTWKAEQGPFAESRFARLGKLPWTLLVQAAEHHVPEVAALIEPFRFVPDWRIDDVMVSYATDGGGVGPHFDQYDVFLIQGAGKRRWQVGSACDQTSKLLPHDDLRLLANFEAVDEWILEPGDILYVPPGIAHHGVAVGDGCMTYSIGFRAPSRSELIAHWCDALLAEIDEGDRYGDPGLAIQPHPGEITKAAIEKLHAMVSERLLDRAAFARWFGEYNSAPKYPEVDWRPESPIGEEELRRSIAANLTLRRNPASRFSFIRQGGGLVVLFVDGRSFDCDRETSAFAEAVCARSCVIADPAWGASTSTVNLIAALIDQGSAAFDDG